MGYILAALFAFVFLFILWSAAKTMAKIKDLSSLNTKNDTANSSAPQNASGAEVIIVGAGVAGSALAYALAKDGRRVHVIERDLKEPDRIVGELLQPGGFLKLMELGLEDCVEEIDAQRIVGFALFKDGNHTKLAYPLEKFDADVSGKSFHNGRFVQRMRQKAATLSNVKLEQGTATSLIEEKGTIKGVRYKSKDGQQHEAYSPLTIVCDGCFSNLRRSLFNPKVDVPSHFVGLILENCELPLPNHGHVVLADPSLVLFYPISKTEVRCFVDVPGQKLPSIASGEMAKYLKTVIAKQVPLVLRDGFVAAVANGDIRTMPNQIMPAVPLPIRGALLVGDALNMRHPLSGGGMTVALSDVVLIRNLLKPVNDLNDASALFRDLESFYTLRKPLVSTLNILAGAFYEVFSLSPNEGRREIRRACFDYISRGGHFAEGFMCLISGINPSPLSLMLHLFGVAVYGVGRTVLPFPTPKGILAGARFISSASGIIFAIIRAEGIRQIFVPAIGTAFYRNPVFYSRYDL